MNKYNPQVQINFTITRDGQEIYTFAPHAGAWIETLMKI